MMFKRKENEQAARNAEVTVENEKLIAELEASRQKIERLPGLLPQDTLDTDIDDAAES